MDNKPYLVLLPVILLSVVGGCTYVPYYDEPYVQDYPYIETPVAGYEYYYYPGAAVYFHLSSGHYYYQHDGHWTHTRYLPGHIHLNHRLRRHLYYEGDKPYLDHHKHHRKYRRHHDDPVHRGRDRSDRDRNHGEPEKHKRIKYRPAVVYHDGNRPDSHYIKNNGYVPRPGKLRNEPGRKGEGHRGIPQQRRRDKTATAKDDRRQRRNLNQGQNIRSTPVHGKNRSKDNRGERLLQPSETKDKQRTDKVQPVKLYRNTDYAATKSNRKFRYLLSPR